MLRIDGVWLCTQPVDMRAGGDRLLAAVVAALGEARAHHGYLFANARGTRIKLLVHDGFGIWCAARKQGRVKSPILQIGIGRCKKADPAPAPALETRGASGLLASVTAAVSHRVGSSVPG